MVSTSTTGGPAKLSPLHHEHVSEGATFRAIDGWQVAVSYGTSAEDLAAAREAGGICDISHFGKLTVYGACALAGLARLLGMDSPLGVGESRDVDLAVGGGGEVSARVAGLSYDEALVLTQASDTNAVRDALETALDGCAHVTDLTSTRAAVHVLGPKSHRVLSKVVELDIDPRVFPDGACAQGKAAEIHALVIRADVGGVLGYQVFVTRDFGDYLWEALVHAGVREGVGPVGLDALETLGAGT